VFAGDLVSNNLNNAYELAYNNACKEFYRWDPQDMAASSGGRFDISTGTIYLKYVNEFYKVSFPSGEVGYSEKDDKVPTTVKIVLLHYLVRGGGVLKNEWISFKEISQGGMLYLEAFNKRIINYLIAVFGPQPALLLKAGGVLGGEAVKYGDFGIQINILPRFPAVFAIWAGDEEFPPRATVLFDASAPFYLPTEDIVVATGVVVSLLAKTAKTLKGNKVAVI
jgi:hypothetical protein